MDINKTSQPKLVAELERLLQLDLVHEQDQKFCKSLCQQFFVKGCLSQKQEVWVGKMIYRSLTGFLPGPDGKPEKPKKSPTIVYEDEVSHKIKGHAKIFEMFGKAALKVNNPKITAKHQGMQIQLKPTGPKSKTPGAILIDDGVSYATSKWYGYLFSDGEFIAASNITALEVACVVGFLKNLAFDPSAYLGQKGKAQGSCCFCKKTLTADESLEVGYGPVCASNYNLPWGIEA